MNHEIFNSHYCEMFRWFLIQMVSYQNACPCLVFVSHTLFPLSWSTQMISLERMEDALLNPCLILTSSVMSENTSRLGDLFLNLNGNHRPVFRDCCKRGLIRMPRVCHTGDS